MDASNLQAQNREAAEDRVNTLVLKAQEGNMDAVDDLVRNFQTPIFNLAYRMVNQREEAGDLTQEIFVKMYRAIRSFKGNSRFSTWLYALAVNTCRSRRKRLQRIEFFEALSLDQSRDNADGQVPHREPVDPADHPNEVLERRETQELVSRAIATIPEDFREILIMRDIEGLSYEEIAQATGCQEGTVKSRLARARSKVRDELIRQGVLCRVNP